MTDAFSDALYFAYGKTSGPKATRDYSPSPSALHGSQRRVKVPTEKGLANHSDLESCVKYRKVFGEALTKEVQVTY